jgi:hypothetical protein
MIINSKCANKNYLCVNEKMKDYDNVAEELNNILELHVKRIQYSKNMVQKYY